MRPRTTGEETSEAFDAWVQGAHNILQTAKDLEVQRVVFASSEAIDGMSKKRERILVKEDDPVGIYPVNLHRTGRIVGEFLVKFYAQNHGVKFIFLIFSSIFGPGQRSGMGAAIKEGILGRECRLRPNRIPDDPIFVKDAVQALHLACFSNRPLRFGLQHWLWQGLFRGRSRTRYAEAPG
jgi:nucleoside-diphosphate-sugar epimerase